MCGFVGLVQHKITLSKNELADKLKKSADAIRHRGPDDHDIWVETDGAAGFGFRRLSIRDLSIAGRQPMASNCGRYTMVYNGEIYNHEEIRTELEEIEARNWRGESDTETLLAAITQWGLLETLGKLDGMFAIALWDQVGQKVSLVRDRFGEKPLYYSLKNGALFFASELKALPALGAELGGISKEATAIYFRKRFIPAPRTIYTNVSKLQSGEIIEFENGSLSNSLYWNSANEAANAVSNPYEGSREDALKDIDQLLSRLVKGRLAADVPLGAFLSGGIDSSLVTALAQSQNSSAVNTYTIRFEDAHYNEADDALRVAKHLGTNHTEIMATEQLALGMIAKMAKTYDEPFSDPSQIPTMLLCQETKKHVTVALSGDGGDEFFAGYSRYLQLLKNWNGPQSTTPAALMAGLPWGGVDYLLGMVKGKPSRYRAKYNKAFMKKAASSIGELSQFTSGFWTDGVPVKGIDEKERAFFDALWPETGNLDLLQELMVSDSMMYLPDDLMVKVDRASMGVSLETRTPFLNQDLAKLCWSLPSDWHANNKDGLKYLLRETIYKYVPRELVDRPKQGFDVPLRHWLRNELKDWGGDLITSARTNPIDVLDLSRIERRWNEHQKGANWEGDLWPALVFLDWYQSQI